MSGARSPDRSEVEPVDPDADLHVPAQRREWTAHRWVLPVIALGGTAGACARYALELWLPVGDGGMPWATFLTNISGCFLIGVLMVHVVEAGGAHPLVRPFLGVGLLGGYTTFSTYAVQTTTLLVDRQPYLALTYLFGTLLAAMVAVVLGVYVARGVLLLRRRLSRHRKGSR
jgi:CrcB protein